MDLKKNSRQRIFDTAVRRTYKQGMPSRGLGGTGCAYRGASGLRCTVGHVLDPWLVMEGYAVDELFPRIGYHISDAKMELLKDLQWAHDRNFGGAFLAYFIEAAKAVAEKHGLEWKFSHFEHDWTHPRFPEARTPVMPKPGDWYGWPVEHGHCLWQRGE
jgi:hypothetical protein